MPDSSPASLRSRHLERLTSSRFDLLVVGGGIIGAAVAAHAARLGLAVALVEARDFAGGTSSASSKLIHGGLRYLRLGDVRLVREAHYERRVLTKIVAPHLVRRVQFLLPLYEHGPYRPAFVQSGIVVYSTLAR
jgi:glycerol-3-phosphate dehydrogenase